MFEKLCSVVYFSLKSFFAFIAFKNLKLKVFRG